VNIRANYSTVQTIILELPRNSQISYEYVNLKLERQSPDCL